MSAGRRHRADVEAHRAATQRREVDATIRWLARLELDDDQRAALRDLAGPAPRRRSRKAS